MSTYIFSRSPFRVQLLHHRIIKNQVRAFFFLNIEINLEDDEVVVETPMEPSEEDKARDLRLMHLRKGFRLSSMCWDDWN